MQMKKPLTMCINKWITVGVFSVILLILRKEIIVTEGRYNCINFRRLGINKSEIDTRKQETQ
jgi:hypothetical protein